MKIPKELNEILHDNFSGSEELQKKLIIFFINEINKGKRITEYFSFIEKHFNEFASIINLIANLKKIGEDKLENFLSEELKSKENRFKIIYKKLEPKLFNNAKIVTISNSTTLINVFKLAFEKFPGIKFYVSESRPVYEGVIMAEDLANIGYDVTLITEAMLPKVTEESDFATIGADKIFPDGNILNKIGTKIIALACNYYKKPFYVISGNNKIVSKNEFEIVKKMKSEIYSVENAAFNVAENIYFEKIEKNLITEIITD